MKKNILLASLILGSIVSAQNTNEALKIKLKEKREKTRIEYDFYAQQKLSQLLSKGDNIKPSVRESLQNQLQQKKSKVAFFFEGKPYFLKLKDTQQISNSNVDYIQEGNITGLNGSFNGEGIKVAVFDGGRAYEKHSDFGGANSTRVNNKEASFVPYDSHATAVTGMIGGQGHNLTNKNGVIVGNTKGMMPLATFDNYSFEDTILEGETEEKDVHQKILSVVPNISNHSYGYTNGWDYQYDEADNAGEGWYWNGNYNATTQKYVSLEGTYLDDDQYYDDIVYNNPSVIIVKAAGNEFGDGPETGDAKYYYTSRGSYSRFNDTDNIPPANCSEGHDCISSGSLAKNIIVVGSTEKITANNGKYNQASDVVKSSFSSAGPRDDGGIKPDIAGVGSNIFHASTDEYGSDDWEQGSGTSYSTPQITGIIGLWTEINKTLFNQNLNAASAKNLLIHSAQEAGNIGPDVWYGWGFADAKAGAELLVQKSNNNVIFEDKTLQNGSTDEILVETDGKQALKVSISWIDPSYKNLPTTYSEADNNRTSTLVNDLDLRITNVETGEIFYPWKLDINNPMAPATKGDNLVDNVEQILIDTPVAGTYKIEVSHKNTLVNNDNNATNGQDYSIIATGYNKIVSSDDSNDDESNDDNSNNETPNNTAVSDIFYLHPVLLTNTESVVDIKSEHLITNVSVYDMAGRLLYDINPNSATHSVDFKKFANAREVYIINVKLGNNTTKQVKILKR